MGSLPLAFSALLLAPPPVTVEVRDGESDAVRDVSTLVDAATRALGNAGIDVETDLGDEGVSVRVELRDEGPDVEVTVIAEREGEALARARALCEICGESELISMTGDLAARVGASLASEATTATLRIDGEPAGAEVRVDGEAVGYAPLDIELPPGTHRVEVLQPGHDPSGYEWDAVAGVFDTFRYVLHPEAGAEAPGSPAGPPPGQGLRIGGWLALGTGLAATGAGGALWAVDGRPHSPSCVPELIDINGVCAKELDTKRAGIGLVVGGLAAVGAAVPMLVIGYKRGANASRDTAGLELGFDGRGFMARGRF